VSYLRSVYLHKDKGIFQIDKLPVDRYAESLGLPGTPKIKFLGKEIAKKKKNASRTIAALQAEIAREQAEDTSDGGAATGEESSNDEEETALPVDAMQAVDEPKVKFSKVCPPAVGILSFNIFDTSLPSVLNTTECSSAKIKSWSSIASLLTTTEHLTTGMT
jgi:hypothetical protein